MEIIDRRVKRTRKSLQTALIELTLEKGYTSITIRDITERADVGYATFFRHYPDKESLLAAVVQSMKAELQELLIPHSMASDPVETGTLIFMYVDQNCDLCKVLLSSTDTMSLLKPVQEIGLREITQIFGVQGEQSLPIEVVANHLMVSLVMLIRWWLDNDMPYPPEQMGKIAARLIMQPVIEAMINPNSIESESTSQ